MTKLASFKLPLLALGSIIFVLSSIFLFSNQIQQSQISQVLGEVDDTGFERVFVSRVVDGDTIELQDGRKVRYIGVDTPETKHPSKKQECFGQEASEFNKQLVEGKVVQLEKDVSETDRYGRLLRYVWLDGEIVNQKLVEEGYAFARSYPPDVAKQELFQKAEQEAREHDLGLWGVCQLNNVDELNELLELETISEECLIKGNISTNGKLYHLPNCPSYDATSIDESKGEHWFCSEEEAITAGWVLASNCQ